MINCTFENRNKASLRHVVVDAIVIDQDKILLVKRAKHLSNGGKWALPGGFVDRNETIEQVAVRELKEETNLAAKSIKLFKIIDSPNRKNEDRQNIAFVYNIEAQGVPKGQSKEVEEVRWFDVSNLPKEEEFAFDHFEVVQSYLKSK